MQPIGCRRKRNPNNSILTMPTAPDIRILVENFTNDLSQVMRRATLEEVHAKLRLAIGEVEPKRRGPGRPRETISKGAARTGKRGRPGKLGPEQLEQHGASILALLEKSPGARSEQLSAAMKIKVKGQKRGTTYLAR
jgi:hypothetical protein